MYFLLLLYDRKEKWRDTRHAVAAYRNLGHAVAAYRNLGLRQVCTLFTEEEEKRKIHHFSQDFLLLRISLRLQGFSD